MNDPAVDEPRTNTDTMWQSTTASAMMLTEREKGLSVNSES
jgi:hypothetical protein